MEEDTRADIARRRLAALTADFDRRYRADAVSSEPDKTAAADRSTETGAVFDPGDSSGKPVDPVPPHTQPDSEPARTGRAAHRKTIPVQWKLSKAHVRVIIGIGAAALVATIGWLVSSRPHESQDSPAAKVDTAATDDGTGDSGTENTEGQKADADELIIDVAGKVDKPGIVELPGGSRVVDAIKAAGGTKGKADTTSLNLARKLQDGEQILVGVKQPEGGSDAGDSGGAGPSGDDGPKVNLNTADTTELETLPGVGPKTAQSIIDYRTETGGFARVDDLVEVKGIGPATLKDLTDRVTV